MLLESGKVSQDNLNPLASRRGRISWISAAHTVLVSLSHSCLVVLWTVPVLSQNPANASTQRKDCSSLSQSGLGVMSVSSPTNCSSTSPCSDGVSDTDTSVLFSLPGMQLCLAASTD